MTAIREANTSRCTPELRDTLADAFVTPHAVHRYQSKVDHVHPNQVVQDVLAGLRQHAVRVRDRGGHADAPRRIDVDVETRRHSWVARLVHDSDRNRLVVETILEHPADWAIWPAYGESPSGWWLTSLHLNMQARWVRDAVGDVCTMHRRVLDLVEQHPKPEQGRVLWAAPLPGVLLLRSAQPVTHTPTDFATKVENTPYRMPNTSGLWWMTGQVNPAKNSKSAGSTGRKGQGRGRKVTLHKHPADVAPWLARKLPGADLLDMQILGARTARGLHRGSHRVTERILTLAAVVDVHDPQQLADAVAAGMGRGKSWGCGLSIWTPAS